MKNEKAVKRGSLGTDDDFILSHMFILFGIMKQFKFKFQVYFQRVNVQDTTPKNTYCDYSCHKSFGIDMCADCL